MKHIPLICLAALTCLTPLKAQAYDLPYVGDQKTIKADYEDTFVYLARDHNLGYLDIFLANPDIDPWLPGAGTKIILPSRHILPDTARKGIVINLAEMRLYAFLKKGEPPITYPLGVGREGLETPTGTTTVTRKTKGPTWTPTARMRKENPSLPQSIGPGANNPLGTHALYLGWPQYLIHGTNRPFGIGRRVSSGCMRMYPESIAALYKLIPTGTQVTVVDQPIKAAWIDDIFYLEVHPKTDESTQIEKNGVNQSFALTEKDKTWIKKQAGDHADQLDWQKIASVAAERRGIPAAILTASTQETQSAQAAEEEEPVIKEPPATEETMPKEVATKPRETRTPIYN